MSAKAYIFFYNLKVIQKTDALVDMFVQRYEGASVVRQDTTLVDDGLRVYEVPPGIIVLRRPLCMSETNQAVIRYDIIGGQYSDDGRARRAALEMAFDFLMASGSS